VFVNVIYQALITLQVLSIISVKEWVRDTVNYRIVKVYATAVQSVVIYLIDNKMDVICPFCENLYPFVSSLLCSSEKCITWLYTMHTVLLVGWLF